jgi:hypothetical protein
MGRKFTQANTNCSKIPEGCGGNPGYGLGSQLRGKINFEKCLLKCLGNLCKANICKRKFLCDRGAGHDDGVSEGDAARLLGAWGAWGNGESGGGERDKCTETGLAGGRSEKVAEMMD